MPFLSSIGTAIAGAFSGALSFLTGGSLLAKIVVAGLSIAARYAVQAIFGNKEQARPQPQASQLETRYGTDLARTVILGKVGTAGHHIYRNAYGKGNSIVQDVLVLSHFRINGVTRVRFDGAWRTLGGTEDSEKGFRLQGTDAQVWVKVYTGTMSQTADAGLISRSNPAGRWTSNHKGAGVAYAIVTWVLDRENLPQPTDLLFEVEGAPLYDWRLDTTAGGDGSHRWADQSTWQYDGGIGTNPVLMMYALERGIYNGTEMMVGKGTDASDLPLAEWTVAANICAEQVGIEARYSAACIVSSGSGVTHDDNMQPLLEACAGSWIELVGEEYPIAGANQSSVATITDDDLVVGERFRLSIKRPRTELVNTVAATFVSPADFYQSSPLATRIDAAALAADRERLAVSIPYRAVTSTAVGDRLADIAIRASRYQANAEICVRHAFLALKPGQWVTWQSDRYGWTKTFQTLTKQLGSFGTNSARNVYLSLQEVGEGIFDPTEYATTPPDAVGQGEPDYLSELGNFIVAPYAVENEDGKKFPAIRVSWDTIDDPTVVAVEIEWRPQFQTEATLSMTVPADRAVAVITNGLLADTVYEVRYRLVAQPVRTVPWTDWVEVTTPDAALVDILVGLANLQDDVRNMFARVSAQTEQRLRAITERLALDAALGAGSNRQEIAAVKRTANAFAAAFAVFEAEVTDNFEAQATAIVGVETQVNNLAAGGRIAFNAQIPPPDGVLAQIEVMARASDEDDFIQTGMLIQVLDDGEGGFTSRIALLTDQFVITSEGEEQLPFVYEDSVLKLNDIWAKTMTAGRWQNATGTRYIDFDAGTIDFQF